MLFFFNNKESGQDTVHIRNESEKKKKCMKGTSNNHKLDGKRKKVCVYLWIDFVYKSSTDFNANSGLS